MIRTVVPRGIALRYEILSDLVTPPRKLFFYQYPKSCAWSGEYILPIPRLAQRCQSNSGAHIEDHTSGTAVHDTVDVAVVRRYY